MTAHLLWWFFILPINIEIATWTTASAPADWEQWRAQWEYTHALRAVLHIFGLGALLLSVLLAHEV